MSNRELYSGLTGTILALRYRLVRLVKAGGMGAVYEAEDTKLGRRVAVKVLSAQLADKPDIVRRFFREAKAPSFAQHPNIVSYLDFDQIADGPAYLVMEYLQGDDLERVLKRRGPLPWTELAPLMLQACRALAASHAAGIIHRDIKPSNFVLLDRSISSEPHVKLIDFGIAKFTEDSRLHSETEVTRQLMGSDRFIAPEMYAWVPANPRTDIYALGVTIFRLLTGKYPESDGYELDPPSRLRPGMDVPPAADAIVMRAAHVNPYARFESVAELEAAIAATLRDPTQVVPDGPAVAPPATEELSPSAAEGSDDPATARSIAPGQPPPREPASVTVMQPSVRIWPYVVATAVLSASIAIGAFFVYLRSARPDYEAAAMVPSTRVESRPPAVAETVEAPSVAEVPPSVATPPTTEPTEADSPDETPAPAPVADPEPSPPPLDKRAARALLAEQLAQVKRCARRDNLFPGMEIKVSVSIDAGGTPKVTVLRAGDTAHAQCIRQHFATLRFPTSARGGSLTHSYRL